MRLLEPQRPDALAAVALAGAVGFAGNWLAARIRTGAGRRLDSPALVADGDHARADAYVSLAVIASAAVVALGLEVADPLIGLAITFVILRITLRVVADGSLSLDAGDPLAVPQRPRSARASPPRSSACSPSTRAWPGPRRRRCGESRSLLHVATDWPGHYPERRRDRAGSSRPAPTSRPASSGPPRRRRCTGPRAATTSRARRAARRGRRHRGPRSGHRRRHAARGRARLRAVEGRAPADRARGTGHALGGRRARAEGPGRGACRAATPPTADDITTRSGVPATAAGGHGRYLLERGAELNWVG